MVRPARINSPKLRPAANSVDTSRSSRMVTALRKKRRWSFQRRFSPRERCPSSIRCLGRGTTTTERSTVDYARSRGTILRPARRISDLSARPFAAMTIACLDGKQAPPRNAREIKGEPCSSYRLLFSSRVKLSSAGYATTAGNRLIFLVPSTPDSRLSSPSSHLVALSARRYLCSSSKRQPYALRVVADHVASR